MRRLSIDFAARDEVPVRHWPVLWWGLLGLGFSLLLSATWQWATISREEARIAARVQAMESDSSATEDTEPVAELTPETITMANNAVKALNYPWPAVLSRLGKHATPGLAMLSLELTAGNANGKLVLQGNSVDQALAYVDALGREPGFQRTVLTRKEPVAADGANDIRFTLEIPAAVSEEAP